MRKDESWATGPPYAATSARTRLRSCRALFAVAKESALAAGAELDRRIPAYPAGAAVCEVEIDAETGAVDIVGYASVDDVGQAINPMIVDGQTHGGIAQGIGQAVAEAVAFEPS